jgi:hypothetical protein
MPPPSMMPQSAKGLAAVINEFGVGDEKAVVMLKALQTIRAQPLRRQEA